jgi:hypothetical protein
MPETYTLGWIGDGLASRSRGFWPRQDGVAGWVRVLEDVLAPDLVLKRPHHAKIAPASQILALGQEPQASRERRDAPIRARELQRTGPLCPLDNGERSPQILKRLAVHLVRMQNHVQQHYLAIGHLRLNPSNHLPLSPRSEPTPERIRVAVEPRQLTMKVHHPLTRTIERRAP